MKNSAALAVNGGTPVRSTPMPPRLAFGPDEMDAIEKVFQYYNDAQLDPGYQGEFEERYCAAFAALLGGGHADAVSSGTAALFVALAALDLPEDSEVISSCITDPGTLSAIIMNRLTPKLADTAPQSYSMGVEQFVARTSGKTRAVIVVHAAGQAAEIDEIVKEAHRRDIRVLEDCSQAHGTTHRGQTVGTFGDIAAFSTMYRKAHMTGSCGGVVFTQDADLHHMALAHADRGKPRWSNGFDDRDPTNYLFPALNFHSNEIACAIGIASLGRLRQTIAARLAFVAGLDELNSVSEVCRPYGWREGDSPFFYPILVDAKRLSVDKISFARAILAEGIGLNPHYNYVVSDWPWVRAHLADEFDCPNARWVRDHSFTLYVNEKYAAAEIRDTLDAIVKVERAFVDSTSLD